MLVKHTLCLSAYSITVRVGYNVAAVHLHKVWFDEKSRLAATRTADYKDIFIPCVFRLLRAAVHRQPFRLCEQHIVLKIRVNVWLNVLGFSP